MDNKNLSIAFLGDIVLNNRYVELSKLNKKPFDEIEKNLIGFDYVIGNLECFTIGEHGENRLKKPRLTTTIETLKYLKNIQLDVACLANNHVYDHLEDGFLKTREFLNEHGILSLGAGVTTAKATAPIIIENSSIKIGLLNYVTKDTNPNLPPDAKLDLNFFDEIKVRDDIQKIKHQTDHIVLCLHWGGKVEGGMFPDYEQPKIAKRLIDAGADLIVGHHSHTFQPYEKYKGKYIFYSLGNFCFSDYWFENKYYDLPERRKVTGIVKVDFKKLGYQIDLKFYKNQITHFSHLKKYPISILNFIHKNILCYKILWNIYYINYKTFLPLMLFLKRKDMTNTNKVKRIVKGVLKRVNSKL